MRTIQFNDGMPIKAKKYDRVGFVFDAEGRYRLTVQFDEHSNMLLIRSNGLGPYTQLIVEPSVSNVVRVGAKCA